MNVLDNDQIVPPNNRGRAPNPLTVKLDRIQKNYKRNALLSFSVLAISLLLAKFPEIFDFPLTRVINDFAERSFFLDKVFSHLDYNFTYSGVVFMCLVWSCWFQYGDPNNRSRILVGTIASLGAGMCSRFMQYTLPTHPRPIYDTALGYHPLPFNPSGPKFNNWSSFPSDHATVFAGLVLVIYISGSRFRWFAIAWGIVIESLRIFMGGHYPSDLAGGAALAGLFVWVAQAPRVVSAGQRVLHWERSSPSLFYCCAFFASYQIATLFVELRVALAGFLHFALTGRIGS